MPKFIEVFWRFLLLGCISFGGPAAHIGYFKHAFVDKFKWLDEHNYAQLISLSQFLPGPGSSQIGFAIGLQRAGLLGGIAAFLGFTLPSFMLLYALAVIDISGSQHQVLTGLVHGLKLLAVVVVADATLSMFNAFCKTKWSISIAVASAVTLLMLPSLMTQMGVLILAAIAGVIYNQNPENHPTTQADNQATNSSRLNKPVLILSALLFIGLPLTAHWSPIMAILADFYRAGSLVFGGGHVVLPLLQQLIGDAMATEQFLLGYAAAQAVPGPMFSLAAFLGAELSQGNLLLGAAVATLAVFLPGLLLVYGVSGAWQMWAAKPKVAGAICGVNAAVVGLLLSALFEPVFISAVTNATEMAFVIAGFFALKVWKMPVLALVIGFACLGAFVL